MKTKIHPNYVRPTCAAPAATSSSPARRRSELHVEVCSNCHPFYTGRQKLVDTGGRVERFQRRIAKGRAAAQRKPGPPSSAMSTRLAAGPATPGATTERGRRPASTPPPAATRRVDAALPDSSPGVERDEPTAS